MIASHVKTPLTPADERGLMADANIREPGLYLVPTTRTDAHKEHTNLEILEEKVRQANSEIARLQSLLLHKERLLQNFYVREQELKAAFFRPQAARGL